MPETPPLTLTIPSDPRMLSVARAFVEAACHISQLDKSTVYAVVLATGEAVSNIIRHAHRDRPQAQLQLQCRLRSDGIEIMLHDEGEPFDLTTVPRMDPAEFRIGGRGVYLMRTLMDELTVAPRAGRGNTLRMVKLRQSRRAVRDVG
jgi:serine/threonine-protein kinase RsbW